MPLWKSFVHALIHHETPLAPGSEQGAVLAPGFLVLQSSRALLLWFYCKAKDLMGLLWDWPSGSEHGKTRGFTGPEDVTTFTYLSYRKQDSDES